jgi:hypothetical protein
VGFNESESTLSLQTNCVLAIQSHKSARKNKHTLNKGLLFLVSLMTSLQLLHSEQQNDNELEISKRKLLWPILRYYHSICLQGLQKTKKEPSR